MAKKTAAEIDVADDGEAEETGKKKSTSERASAARSDRVQQAVSAAWGKEQPKELQDVTFGRDHVGHGYRVHIAPVLRDVAKSLALKANPENFGKLIEELQAWDPENRDWQRVKCLLLVCCNELSDAMGTVGVDELDDDFLVKAPDLARRRRETAGATGMA